MTFKLISRLPDAASQRPHLLFIPGAFHGAWCWEEYFLPWFAGQGWPCHAITLRGHRGDEPAGAIRQFTLQDYGDDVHGAMTEIGAPVVLIGHSMGGVIAERVWHASKEVAGLVFLAASPLKPALSVVMRMMAAKPWSLIRGQVFGDAAALREAMQGFFLSPDLPESERAAHLRKLSLESPRAIGEVFGRKALRRPAGDMRPVLVIGGAQDWSIPLADHQTLAARYDAPLEICEGYHDLMLDPHWQAAAETLHDWLTESFGARRIGAGG